MNRRHSYEDFKNMVKYLRSKDPLFSISTDIIVGFSGETEDMFQDTIKAFKECEFDFAYMFKYSERPKTLAERNFEDNVPEDVKSQRLSRIIKLQQEMSLKSYQAQVGKVSKGVGE